MASRPASQIFTPTKFSPYDALSPSNFRLEISGKSVLITGGGSGGIGAFIAAAFAEADAPHVRHHPHRSVLLLRAPGAVKIKMYYKSGMDGLFKNTDGRLTGHFVVWIATSQADFLNGRFAWANWDIDDLIARREEITEKGLLRTGLKGGEKGHG